jgi:hypothetical protein
LHTSVVGNVLACSSAVSVQYGRGMLFARVRKRVHARASFSGRM